MSNDDKIIKDLVILGHAAPVEMKDGRKSICTAGYSPSEGLVRLYPVPTNANPHWWNIVEVPVERNKQDIRYESWKIKGSKAEWDKLFQKIKHVKELTTKQQKTSLLKELLQKFEYDCVNDLNAQKGSLGFIRPTDLEPYFKDRERMKKTIQTTLDSPTLFKTAGNYPKIPYMKYKCSKCKTKKGHNQQILEWGAYEWMRNNTANLEGLWENYHINDPDWDHVFLVGNMVRQLTSFLIISIFRFKKPW